MQLMKFSRRKIFVLISIIGLISAILIFGNAKSAEPNPMVITPSKPENLPWCDELETAIADDEPTPFPDVNDINAPATCMIRGEIILVTPGTIEGPTMPLRVWEGQQGTPIGTPIPPNP